MTIKIHWLDGYDSVSINGEIKEWHTVCGHFNSLDDGWIGTFTLVSLIIMFILIAGTIALVIFLRLRQRPMLATETITQVATGPGAAVPGTVITGPGGVPVAVQGPPRGQRSPPPMGSAEAEFQNDFIQVFPMYHLEPQPEKNTTPYIIR